CDNTPILVILSDYEDEGTILPTVPTPPLSPDYVPGSPTTISPLLSLDYMLVSDTKSEPFEDITSPTTILDPLSSSDSEAEPFEDEP
nr:hypothetical protein [Tanacetum cinerariifolium]